MSDLFWSRKDENKMQYNFLTCIRAIQIVINKDNNEQKPLKMFDENEWAIDFI